MRTPAYVSGGYGGVESIARTAFQEGGLRVLEHKCALHRQASFYANWWPPNATVGASGDVYAFYLPPMDSGAGQPSPVKPVLGAATFLGAFVDRPEVNAVAAYLSTSDFANQRAKTGGVISANRGL